LRVTTGELSHVTSFPVTWLPPPASYSIVGSEMYSVHEYASFWPYTATSRWLPVKWRPFRVTFGHLRSRDIISCHVNAYSCGRPPCRKWNVQYMRAFGLLQQLPGIFRWNDVTFGSIPVTWGQVTSSATWLYTPASYSLVGCEMYSLCEFLALYNHFQVTSNQMTSLLGHLWSPEVTWRHFLSRDCLLLRATAL